MPTEAEEAAAARAQAIADNAPVLAADLDWLETAIETRFAAESDEDADGTLPAPPSLSGKPGPYAGFAATLDDAARLTLILALAPHLAPQLLDSFLIENGATHRPFTEFGGVRGQSHAGFLPTIETALFLIAGTQDLKLRLELMDAFEDHPLTRAGLLLADPRHPEEPGNAAPLRVTPTGLRELLTGPA